MFFMEKMEKNERTATQCIAGTQMKELERGREVNGEH